MGATEAEGLAETKICDRPISLVPTLSQPARGRDRWEIIAKSPSHVARWTAAWTGPTAIRFQVAFDFRTSAARCCCSCAICATWSSTRSLAPEPRCSISGESPPGRSWCQSVELEGSPYGGLPNALHVLMALLTDGISRMTEELIGHFCNAS